MSDSHSSRAALLLVILVFSALLGPGLGRASAGSARHSVRAPASASEILAYVTFDPPGEEGEGQEDTVHVIEPKVDENAKPSNQTNPFDRPDTLRSGGGGGGAPLETLGTSPAFRGPQAAATPLPTGPHLRRGVLGIHPLALLAGLIALHIFIVTTVVK